MRSSFKLLWLFTAIFVAGCGRIEVSDPQIVPQIETSAADPVRTAVMLHMSIANDARAKADMATEKAAYEEILAVEPRNSDAIRGLAALAGGSNDPKTEITLLKRAVRIDDSSEIRTRLATLYENQGDYGKARHQLAQALLLEPDNAAIRADYALLLAKLGYTDQALKEIDWSLDQPAAGLRERRIQGEIYRISGFDDGALIAFAATGDAPGIKPKTIMRKPFSSNDPRVSAGAKQSGAGKSAAVTVKSAKANKSVETAPSVTVRIQLGAFKNRANAEKAPVLLAKHLGKAIDLVAYAPANETKNALYRVRSVPLPDKNAAKSLCGKLRALGQDCVAILHHENKWRAFA